MAKVTAETVFSAEGIERIRLSSRSGRISVSAEPTAEVTVEHGKDFESSLAEGVLTLSSRSSGLTITCPPDLDISVGTTSSAIELRGRFGEVAATTVSGDIKVDTVQSADLRAVSGSITLLACEGTGRVSTKSGRAEVGTVGEFAGSSISGSVSVGHCDRGVRVKTVSGKVDTTAAGGGDVAVETLSGSVTLRLPVGIRPRASLRSRGGHRCDCPEGDDMKVAIQSLSGKILVTGT